jgi:hypothetical protein
LKLSDELAAHLGFKNFEKLNEQTGDPEVTTKLLLAHYRRLKKLKDFVQEGKAKLPVKPKEDGQQPEPSDHQG